MNCRILFCKAPERIIVNGRKGKNDLVNGMYQRGKILFENKVYYQKLDGSCVLRWDPEGAWIFSENLDDGAYGFACCRDKATYPHEIKHTWKVCVQWIFQDDISIKIRVISLI